MRPSLFLVIPLPPFIYISCKLKEVVDMDNINVRLWSEANGQFWSTPSEPSYNNNNTLKLGFDNQYLFLA